MKKNLINFTLLIVKKKNHATFRPKQKRCVKNTVILFEGTCNLSHWKDTTFASTYITQQHTSSYHCRYLTHRYSAIFLNFQRVYMATPCRSSGSDCESAYKAHLTGGLLYIWHEHSYWPISKNDISIVIVYKKLYNRVLSHGSTFVFRRWFGAFRQAASSRWPDFSKLSSRWCCAVVEYIVQCRIWFWKSWFFIRRVIERLLFAA